MNLSIMSKSMRILADEENYKLDQISEKYNHLFDKLMRKAKASLDQKIKEKQEFKDMVIWDTAPPSIEDLLKIANKAKICVFWGGNYYGLPPSRCWLVWDKQNAVPTMSDCEIAWTNLDANTKRFSHPVGRVLNGHPSEKPLRLMEWTLQTVKASGLILDPFMGSGTTGVASLKINNKFIGIERDPKYFDIACKRIEQATKQVDMFIEKPKQEQTSFL